MVVAALYDNAHADETSYIGRGLLPPGRDNHGALRACPSQFAG